MGFCVADRPRRSSRPLGDLLQALEAEREMGSAPAADHGVDLVHDHGADRAKHLAASFGRQQQIQRFGRGHQHMRRLAQHGGTIGLGGVAGSHGRGDAWSLDPERLGHPPNATPGLGEVSVDVGAQCFERRHVDDPDLVGKRRAKTFLQQVVERCQECRERLAGSGRRRDERISPLTNRDPAELLRRRRRAERFSEPPRGNGVEVRERHEPTLETNGTVGGLRR